MGWRREKHNRWNVKADKSLSDHQKRLGNIGELDQSIIDEWLFWGVVQKVPDILAIQDKLSFVDLQKINAVFEMKDEYAKAFNMLQMTDMEKK